MTIQYSDLIKDIHATIKADSNAQNKWVKTGDEVAEFYGSQHALDEVKAQFMADAILPAIDKKHGEALAKDIPRKNSKEFNALDSNGVALWESINQAKKDARSVVSTYYKRILKYAFGSDDKTEGDEVAKPSDTTKDIEILNNFIKRLEKSENRPYDVAQVINNLKVTLPLIHE